MSRLGSVGNLMHIWMDQIIECDHPTSESDFLISASAKVLLENEERNWLPVIVSKIANDEYKVIGNSFVYAVAESAGIDRIWCIIADDQEQTAYISKVLAREILPKINLSQATYSEIESAIDYLTKIPGSLLKSIKKPVAVNRITDDPLRPYWKSFEPISKLKCGITKGAKLKFLQEAFYLDPLPFPEDTQDPRILQTFTVTKLHEIVRKRDLRVAKNLKKADLIDVLSK